MYPEYDVKLLKIAEGQLTTPKTILTTPKNTKLIGVSRFLTYVRHLKCRVSKNSVGVWDFKCNF